MPDDVVRGVVELSSFFLDYSRIYINSHFGTGRLRLPVPHLAIQFGTGQTLDMALEEKRKFKTIRHFHRPDDCHELTFSCYQRMPLLSDGERRQLLAESVDKALVAHGLCLSAFVFMPEHVHLVVWPRDPSEAHISEFLKTLKQSCSTKIKHRLAVARSPLLEQLTVVERPGKTVFRFWQEGPGFDRNLNRASTVQASIDYIHTNPVKRGLCARAVDWCWSSARHYYPESVLPAPPVPTWTPLPAAFLAAQDS